IRIDGYRFNLVESGQFGSKLDSAERVGFLENAINEELQAHNRRERIGDGMSDDSGSRLHRKARGERKLIHRCLGLSGYDDRDGAVDRLAPITDGNDQIGTTGLYS